MYRISEIKKLGQIKYSCKRIDELNMYDSVTFVDCLDNSEIVVGFSNPSSFDRGSLLTYLRKEYGIKEVSGVGKEFIFAFNDYELELLDFLDWNGYIQSYPVPIKSSLYETDSSEHLTYVSESSYATLTNILLDMPKSYTINGNTLVIHLDDYRFPTFTISDISKFNRLLTKMIVLRGKDV